jgi:cytochrome c oxidase subunit 3
MSQAAATTAAHPPGADHASGPPVSAAKLAVWLFLASEVMFFTGILGAYTVLKVAAKPVEVAPGEFRSPFAIGERHLDKRLGLANTVVLLASGFAMLAAAGARQAGDDRRLRMHLGVTLLLGTVFLGIKGYEYHHKFHTFLPATVPETKIFSGEYSGEVGGKTVGLTVVTAGESKFKVRLHEGGLPTFGAGAPVEAGANLADGRLTFRIGDDGKPAEWTGTVVAGKAVLTRGEPAPSADGASMAGELGKVRRMMPWSNTFFGMYFALTGAHLLHMVGGLLPLGVILLRSLMGLRPGEQTIELFGLYWHFVDIVWLFLFPTLYLMP